MKVLKALESLKDIARTHKLYLMIVTPYSRCEAMSSVYYRGSGIECIEKLKEIFEYEEWLEDRNYNDCRAFLNEFLEDIDSSNGDGQDYVEFIVLNKSRK